jgi:glycosyltransferase involved in cell wall biosynthesis
MKILINALSARRGGGQTYLINLLRHLDPNGGLEVDLLAPASLSIDSHPRVSRIDADHRTEGVIQRSAWERLRLPGLLRERGAHVLFCPGGLVNTRAPEGCRTATMFRNMVPFDRVQRARYPIGRERLRNWILERAMLSSMARSDLVIFISEWARQVVEARLPERRGRAITIPHGLSSHFRVAPGQTPDRPSGLPDGPYLLYVSTFEPYKAQREVVQGFAQLLRERDTPEKLLLAGHQQTAYGAEVRALVESLGIADRVVFLGPLPYPELPAVYANATANVFASECENCPNILLEALGAGRPLLSSNRQPMPEFGGDAPVYFDPSSPESFAAAARALLDDPDEMRERGARSRAQAERFDWERSAARTWEALAALARDA